MAVVSPVGLAPLETLPALEVLDLRWTPIDDGAVEMLERIRTIRHIGLSERQLSDDALERPRKALPNCDVNVWKDWVPPPLPASRMRETKKPAEPNESIQ